MWCGGGRRVDEAKSTETFGLVLYIGLYPATNLNDIDMYVNLGECIIGDDIKDCSVTGNMGRLSNSERVLGLGRY